MSALDQLYAAVDPAAQSGRFYGPSGLSELRGYPVEVQPVAAAKNEDRAAKATSREMVYEMTTSRSISI